MFVLTRRRKIITLVLVDSLLLVIANAAAVMFMIPFVAISMDFRLFSTSLWVIFYLLYGYLFKIFSRINRYTNAREMIAIFGSLSASAFSSIMILYFIDEHYSLRFVIFTYLLSLILIICSRLIWRIYVEQMNRGNFSSESVKNTIIVGAGEGGRIFI